jgi:hypothetical protein
MPDLDVRWRIWSLAADCAGGTEKKSMKMMGRDMCIALML